jgi:hypothetical protein
VRVGAQCLGAVAGGGVGAQQPQVRRLPERLEPDQLLGGPDSQLPMVGGQVGVDEYLQAAGEHVLQRGALALEPQALLAWQQRPAGDVAGRRRGRERQLHVAGRQCPFGLIGLAGGQFVIHGGRVRQGEQLGPGRAGQHVVCW